MAEFEPITSQEALDARIEDALKAYREKNGDPVALPEGMPLSDGLIYAPGRQVFIAGSGGWYRLYPAHPEDWPDIQPGAEVSWTEALALLRGD